MDSLAYLLAESLAAKEQEEKKKKMAEEKEKALRVRKEEEEKKLKAVTEEEDPEGWQEAYDSDGDLYYRQRRTRRANWSPPPWASGPRKKKLRRMP